MHTIPIMVLVLSNEHLLFTGNEIDDSAADAFYDMLVVREV